MPEIDPFVIAPKPAAHFGVGAIEKLPGVVRATGADHVVVVTDAKLTATPVITTVIDILADACLPSHIFTGVHSNPTIADLAAGAQAVADAAAQAAASASAAAVAATLKASPPAGPAILATGRIALVAVGGGSPIDAAKGIALAAVNPQRGRDLDYRGDFEVPALPIVAVPTTAGTGAETNAFAAVTDPVAHRTFYVGHASSMPAAAILDPALTVSLPPLMTAATGMDALTHALESYLSLHPNPWSDGIALQVIQMIAANLPRACRMAPTWPPGRSYCWPRTWPGWPRPTPGSASATPSGSRWGAGGTSPTGWRCPCCCPTCSASTCRSARSGSPTSPSPSGSATATRPRAATPRPPSTPSSHCASGSG